MFPTPNAAQKAFFLRRHKSSPAKCELSRRTQISRIQILLRRFAEAPLFKDCPTLRHLIGNLFSRQQRLVVFKHCFFASFLLYLLCNAYVFFTHEQVRVLHVAIISSTYFANESGSLPPNSMAVLFNSEKQRHPEFLCWSKNASHTTVTPSSVLLAEKPDGTCNWTQYIATCDVVEGPHEFGLTAKSGDSTVVKIPYRPVLNRKLKVVVCYGPLFFAERWQNLILALEVYRQYGADLQVVYVQSMLVELMNFLKVYEKEGVAQVEPWALTDFGKNTLGYDPNSEMMWLNQATAHTDCLLKHKTAAEFIIFGDIDDLLLPKLPGGYAKEFEVLSALNPTSAGFVYPRYKADFDTTTSPTQFSLSRMLRKTRISNETAAGKYVVIPSRIKSAWLHKPGVIEDGFEMRNIAEEFNFILHMSQWRSVDKYTDEGKRHANDITGPYRRQLRDILPIDQVIAIESNFRSFLDRHDAYDLFQRLPQTIQYYPLMEKCHEKLLSDDPVGPHKCTSPVSCEFPTISGVNCAVAKRPYSQVNFTSGVVVHYTNFPGGFHVSNDGCRMK